MKVVKLVAENVKKLKAVTIEAGKNAVLKITGANEQGKTTVLDCIMWALAGTKQIQEQPIRKGEKKARIQLDLGDMIVTRRFTEKSSVLEVTNKDGAVFKSPQAILDNLIGKFSFDPLKFAKADKKTQVETLLSLVDLQVDENKLKELSGKPIQADGNALDKLNTAYKAVYDERTEVNREVVRTEKVAGSYSDAEEAKPVSVSELIEKRDTLQAENADNEQRRQNLYRMQDGISNAARVRGALVEDIELLEKRLQDAKDKLAQHDKDAESFGREYEAESKAVEALEDHDLTEINEQIRTAEETNAKARRWEEKKKADAEYTKAKNESEALTERLDKIKEYKEELVKSAQFPVDGLDFGNGGVMYQGVPFEQASSAQKLQVSLAVAMALNPKLRVIRIDDGSLLDKKHMAIIEEMAKENDYQIWMECVDESGKVGIYIEDGEVKALEEAEQTALI